MSGNPCSNSCSYRKLYESSQISLSDMSAKQAGALARVGRIRAALISSLRKNFPSQSAEFERSCGMRMSDMDDELILAFSESVVSANNSRDSKTTLSAIGQALLSKGVIKDVTKPVSWIDDIGSMKSNAESSTSFNAHLDKAEAVAVKKDIVVKEESVQSQVESTEETNYASQDKKNDNSRNEEITLGWVEGTPPLTGSSLADLFKIDINREADITENRNSWSPSPLKPELAKDYMKSQHREKKIVKRKEIRVQAVSPKGITNEGHTELDERLRGVFTAASTIPRPVFVKDLLSVCDNMDVITAWEEEARGNADIGLRFISPKQRHRHRGSLIVPSKNIRVTTSKQIENWWGSAVDLYMGSKLYELAVLLHRVGDEIISYDFNDFVAVIKVNTSKGIVTLIVLMNDRLDKNSPAREMLASLLNKSANEKIAYIAVLTTLGEEKEMDRLVASLVEITNEDISALSCPVVAAKSWEYADDRGSTAIQITS